MGYQAQFVQWSFQLSSIVPSTDPEMIYFDLFKKEFGEDGNILVLGIQDSSVYEVDNFKKLKFMTDELSTLYGVKDVLSLPTLKRLVKDKELKRFRLEPIFDEIPEEQATLDSMIAYAMSLEFYKGQLLNAENGANMVLVSVEKEIMNLEIRYTFRKSLAASR